MLHGLNEFSVAGKRYLLVGVSASHLARIVCGGVPGRSALAEWRTGVEPWASSYDLDSLLDPIWSDSTLLPIRVVH